MGLALLLALGGWAQQKTPPRAADAAKAQAEAASAAARAAALAEAKDKQALEAGVVAVAAACRS
jgi:hypothetical protein